MERVLAEASCRRGILWRGSTHTGVSKPLDAFSIWQVHKKSLAHTWRTGKVDA